MNSQLLYICNARLPTEKAHGYQILQMCQAFQQNGLNVRLYHPKRVNFGIAANATSIEEFYGLNKNVPTERLGCIDLISSMPERFEGPAFYLQTFTYALNVRKRLLDQYKRGEHIPLIYLRDINLAFLLFRLLPERFRRSIAIEIHGLSAIRIRRRRQINIIKQIPVVACLTSAMRDRLVDEGIAADRLIIARDAVNLETFDVNVTKEEARERLGLPPDKLIASFVGKFLTMGMEKGIPEILLSAKRLIDDFPSLVFYFVGGPLDRVAEYERILCSENLPRERFVFLEKQPIDEVPYYLKASDVLLTPFPWTEHYAYYMSPLKLFEYMSSGRPIVGTQLPALGEILTHDHNALLAEPGNPESLAVNIRKILMDPALGQHLAAQAFENVQNHTWKKRALSIHDFIGKHIAIESHNEKEKHSPALKTKRLNSSLKILYVSNARLPTEKAHGYQILQMCQAFIENGNQIHLFSPKRVNFGIAAQAQSLEEFYGLRSQINGERLPCIDLISAFPERFQKGAFLLQTLTFALNVRRRLLTDPQLSDFHLMYLRDINLAFLLFRLLPPRFRSRMAIEVHSLSSVPRLRSRQANLLKQLPAIGCLTTSMKERLITEGVPEDKLTIARDAVDLQSFDLVCTREEARARLGIAQTPMIASYVGKFHQMGMEKGIPEIVKAAKNLLNEFPSLVFYFVGGPLDRVPAYKRIIEEERMPSDRFVFLEKQPIDEVPYFLKASDILLMPSPWTEQFAYYTSPLKLFEYMSSHRPIIATHLPSLSELLTHEYNALLAKPGDPATLAACIRRLLRSPELASQIAARAYEQVQEFTWKQRARDILDFVTERISVIPHHSQIGRA